MRYILSENILKKLQIGDPVDNRISEQLQKQISTLPILAGIIFMRMTITSLEGTMFEKPVAHGYFILSAAAGLFVENSQMACLTELWH